MKEGHQLSFKYLRRSEVVGSRAYSFTEEGQEMTRMGLCKGGVYVLSSILPSSFGLAPQLRHPNSVAWLYTLV